jgi:uncharacterized membrane protein YfcA
MPGFGIVAVPLMVLVVGDARQSAGWLLPLLCTSDLFALYFWRKHGHPSSLLKLAPWVIAGMGIGAATLSFPNSVIRPMVGGIVLFMLGFTLWRRYRASAEDKISVAAPYGVAAGFSTTVANLAGPVMNLYLLSKKLPKEEFMATGAWFFFFINLSKVPIYAFHGLFSARSLTFDVCVLPGILAGALTGKWLVQHIPQKVFEWTLITLTAISAVLLFR